MIFPPIRYPLPTLVLAVLLGLSAWTARPALDRLRASLAEAYRRVAVVLPPTEADPAFTRGPLPSRGLVLASPRTLAATPDGPRNRPLAKGAAFVDLLNRWPPRGEATHYLVNDGSRLDGWIPAAEILRWDSRLVLVPNTVPTPRDSADPRVWLEPVATDQIRPVLDVDPDRARLRVLTWRPSAEPWTEPLGEEVVAVADLNPWTLRVLLTRSELIACLRAVGDPDAAPPPDDALRLTAIAGRLLSPTTASNALDDALRRRFAPVLDHVGKTAAADSRRALTTINHSWKHELALATIPFRAVPLAVLP